MPAREGHAARRSGRRSRPSATSTRRSRAGGARAPSPTSGRPMPAAGRRTRAVPGGRPEAEARRARASQLPRHGDGDLVSGGNCPVDDERGRVGTARGQPVSASGNRTDRQAGTSLPVEGRVRPQAKHKTIGRDRRTERDAQRSVSSRQATIEANAKRVADAVRRRWRQHRGDRACRDPAARIRGRRRRSTCGERDRDREPQPEPGHPSSLGSSQYRRKQGGRDGAFMPATSLQRRP
jgi:hypothetical protein